jgi:hypothetical protein
VTKIADRAEYRYLLTGTPILNSPLDIFSQYRALDSGKTFGKSFFAFRAHYFYDKNANMPRHVHFPNWQIRPTSYDELNEKIYAKAMRVEKKAKPIRERSLFIKYISKSSSLENIQRRTGLWIKV